MFVVIDKTTGKDAQLAYPNCPLALTPEGNVVWWREEYGWEVDEDQARYEVRFDTVDAPPKISNFNGRYLKTPMTEAEVRAEIESGRGLVYVD